MIEMEEIRKIIEEGMREMEKYRREMRCWEKVGEYLYKYACEEKRYAWLLERLSDDKKAHIELGKIGEAVKNLEKRIKELDKRIDEMRDDHVW